eukprot:6264384-Lingulodinium_polyedra.AAC.1
MPAPLAGSRVPGSGAVWGSAKSSRLSRSAAWASGASSGREPGGGFAAAVVSGFGGTAPAQPASRGGAP